MKKPIALAIIFLSLLSLIGTIHAAETSFSGVYRLESWNEWNFDKKSGLGPPDYIPLQNSWFEQSFRLKITHTRSEYLKAVVILDLVEDTWGQNRGMRINNSASDFIGRAYLEFQLPKVGIISAGLFNAEYGYGLLFSDDTFTGIRWARYWRPFLVSVLYGKTSDNISTTTPRLFNRDTDFIGVSLKYIPNSDHMIWLFGGVALDNTGSVLNESYFWKFWGPSVNRMDIDATIGFAGISYSGRISDAVEIKMEYSSIFGSARIHRDYVPSREGVNYPEHITVTGWNLYIDASYYSDQWRIGLAFIMGSGQNHYWGPEQVRSINLNYIHDDGFRWGAIIANGGGGLNSAYANGSLGLDANIENVTSAKIYFEITPIEKLNLMGSVIWGKWTQPVGDIPATGSKSYLAYPHPAYRYSTYDWKSWKASDDLGWEVDFGFTYELMKGLTYSFSSGVLFPGDSWDYVDWDGTREEWGPIISVYQVLQYRF